MGARNARNFSGGGGGGGGDPATSELRRAESELNIAIRRLNLEAKGAKDNIAELQRRVHTLYTQEPPGDEVTRKEAVRSHVMAKRRLRQVNSTIANLEMQRDSYRDLGTSLMLQTTMGNVMENLRQNAPMVFSGRDAVRHTAQSGAALAEFQENVKISMEFMMPDASNDDAELEEEVDRIEAEFRDAHQLAALEPVPESAVMRPVRRSTKIPIQEQPQPRSASSDAAAAAATAAATEDDKKYE